MRSHPRAGLWARFSARFDAVLLQPPQEDLARPEAEASAIPAVESLAAALTALCQAGSPYACQHHLLAATGEQRALQGRWLHAQLLRLDGSTQMRKTGGPARQALHRLAIKCREALGPQSATGPWDCGLLNTGPAALAQAQQFRPRRSTFIVAWELDPPWVEPLHAALQQGAADFDRPVRLWVLNRP